MTRPQLYHGEPFEGWGGKHVAATRYENVFLDEIRLLEAILLLLCVFDKLE